MSAVGRRLAVAAAASLLVVAGAGEGGAQMRVWAAPQTLIIGLDTGGKFQGGGYDDALAFLAHYVYGHLNGLGGLERPRDLFVAGVAGGDGAFRPTQDFAGKSIERIEQDLRQWYPQTDTPTDFNAFFRRVAGIVHERNLLLRPISVVVVTDGVPDVAGPAMGAGSPDAYRQIDLGPLEYLARRVTVRIVDTSPPVGDRWRALVRRQRVRLSTVEHAVMTGWRAQLRPEAPPAEQAQLWQWVREKVDFRVRRGT